MGIILSAPFLLGALLLLVIIIAVLVETENATWASVLTTGAIVFIAWKYWEQTWNFLFSDPLNTLMYVGIYILCGVVWSLIKWKRYISPSAKKFKKLKEEFIDKHEEIGSNWKKWINHLNDNYKGIGSPSFYDHDTPENIMEKIVVNANDKKGVIVSWVMYWPMSLGATFLNDPFRRFFSWIFDLVSGIYGRMARYEVSGLEEGMEKYEESEQKK